MCVCVCEIGQDQDLSNEGIAIVTMFKGAMGEYLVNEGSISHSSFRFIFMNVLFVLWMIFGAIVLLNLLIALMAKSFDTIHEHTNQEVTYAVVNLAYELDKGDMCVFFFFFFFLF